MEKIPTKSALRKRAEKAIARLVNNPCAAVHPEDIQGLLHEVKVYQVELEIQNDELRAAQLEIESSRRRYSDLYEYAPVGYFTFDRTGLILEVNLTGSSLLGIERKSLIQRPFLNYVAPASGNVFRTHMQDLFESDGKRACELILRKGRKESFFARLESLAILDERGQAAQMRSAVIDISERKQAEEERNRAYDALEARVKERTALLLEANERIASVLSSITDAFLSLDSEGRINEINDVAAGMFQHLPGELIGRSIREVYPQELDADLYKKYRLALETQCPFHFETHTPANRWFEVHAYPRGEKLEVYFREVTDRKRREAALESRTIELETAIKELESFSYSVAHDLRSPIRAIDGFAKMILKEYGASFDEELRRKLNVIWTSAFRMGRMIDDLLAFSRLGRTALRLQPIPLKDMALKIREEIEESEAVRDLAFVVKDIPPALGDRNLIRQVVYNLLSNAIKFTRDRKRSVIEVGGYAENGQCVVYMKDNGIGFDMRYHDKLFGVFQRLHGPEFPGTGIGLAIVHQIISRHGGKVWAEGKTGKGATFFFSLPADAPESPQS
jgi:PAS domain S-box-containing protein